MPTLGEACQQLRIGRVTLEKWIKRLGIETTRHEWDYRYQVIAPEDVERIAEARRKLPGRSITGAFIPSSSKSDDRRSPTAETGAGVHAPMFTPLPRQRPLQRDSFTALPDGMMSRSDAAEAHNVPLTTLRRWCDEGRVETHTGIYGGEHGRRPVIDPITRRGLAQFYALASSRAGFTPCSSCPHAEDAQIAE